MDGRTTARPQFCKANEKGFRPCYARKPREYLVNRDFNGTVKFQYGYTRARASFKKTSAFDAYTQPVMSSQP